VPIRSRRLVRSTLSQSVLPPSYVNVFPVGSLRSTVISRFLATTNPSDSRRSPPVVMSSHRPLRPSPSPRRVSQVPRLICPRALSPTTPGGPMAAYARCFATGDGLHRSLAGWPLSTCVTRPNRVRFRYGSRVRSAGLRHRGSLRGPPALLPVERAINRATSFHVARPTSLILAHQRRREEHVKDSIVAYRGMGILPMMLHGSRLQRDATPIRTQRGEGPDLRHPPGSSLGNTQPATSKPKRTLSPLKCSRS